MLPPNSAGTIELRASPPAGRNPNAPEKRMQRNLHRELRIQRLERRRVVRVVDGIEPDLLGQRRMQHRRVVGLIQRSKARRKCSDALIAVHFKIENLYRQSVARLRALNIKRPGKRIVALGHAERVPRLLDGIAETVERIGVENVARFQPGDRRHRSVNILHIVDRGVILHDIAGRGLRREHSPCQESATWASEYRPSRTPPE